MELGLTIPLQRQLRTKPLPHATTPTSGDAWDLHCITLQGKSCLLAVHCATRYTFTLYHVSPFQWQQLDTLFLEGLQATCHAMGLTPPGIDSPIAFTRTHGRREVAFLNRAWDSVVPLDYALDPSTQSQLLLDYAVNSQMCNCAGFPGKGLPYQRFLALYHPLPPTP